MIVTGPLEPFVAAPVVITTLPVETDEVVPELSTIEPLVPAVVDGPVRRSTDPVAPGASPTDRIMPPDFAVVPDTPPVAMVIAPVAPLVVVPELRIILPLVPVVAASPDRIVIPPLVTSVPPDTTKMWPPAVVEDDPAVTTIGAPASLALFA